MYTDEDLENAVRRGIFSPESVETFRSDYLDHHNTHTADEENFRLVGSFNDIFVVIAVGLLLLSLGWVTYAINPSLSAAVVAFASWALAEFFVLKRKMALPAIALLVAFVGSVFAAAVSLFEFPGENALTLAGLAATMAAWLHWKRFKVPITVAAGASALVVFVISLIVSVFPGFKDYLVYLLFLGGVAVFALAMYWDASDLQRVSGKSDVAFWLHLASAPLIVHPVFTGLGIFEGNESAAGLVSIILLYLFLTFVSVVIDRRAFMVSALIYVLVALTELLENYGLAGDGFAYVGVLIGFSLLLLSGFWHKARLLLVGYLPEKIKNKVPVATQ
ncbi:MAG: hypothetical protein ACRBB6_01655 [Neptuniibacter sp.]